MVSDSGQIYTIEGVAAGILMLVTAYLVISTTTILTPQDVHIIDMQLQQVGSDALAMMDKQDIYGNESTLAWVIRNNNTSVFQSLFLSYTNSSVGSDAEYMAYNATIYYRNNSNEINSVIFNASPYYRENAVKVSRWVYLPNFENTTPSLFPDMENGNRTVLLEVLLWRT
jgi:hypothetical protein